MIVKSSTRNASKQKETVLVMQGGGSLGAYECGVCKVLAKHDIEFDIIAGTSIGAINAALIAAGYTKDGIRNSVKRCEDFWLELAETVLFPAFLPYKERSQLAAWYSLFYGNEKAFTPLWFMSGGLPYYHFFNSPYLYDVTRLKETVAKFVDFRKLSQYKPNNLQLNKNINSIDQVANKRKDKSNYNNTNSFNSKSIPRLILTATNVQTGEPVIFDSNNTDITVNHVIASAGYAVYGLPWTRLNGNIFGMVLSYITHHSRL